MKRYFLLSLFKHGSKKNWRSAYPRSSTCFWPSRNGDWFPLCWDWFPQVTRGTFTVIGYWPSCMVRNKSFIYNGILFLQWCLWETSSLWLILETLFDIIYKTITLKLCKSSIYWYVLLFSFLYSGTKLC